MIEKKQKSQEKEAREIDRRCLVFYLRVLDEADQEILGYLIDISEKGIKLMGEGKVEIHEKYRLRMRLPTQMKKDRNELIFTATSIWCKPDKESRTYLAGFQMEDLESASRRLIADLVRDFGHNQAG